MGDWGKTKIMVKAGTIITKLNHQNRNRPHDYNRDMLAMIRMCLTSGNEEAVEVGKELDTRHIKWQMENGLFQ